jgi:transcriptional regulator GlxA family with amidase domain
MLHLHIDRRFLSQVVGEQAKRDYLELCNAQSRKAYDANVLMQASLALERAMEVAENLHVQKKKMNYQIASGLVGDIFLPLIKSDLCEMKVSTRQKILSRSLDYIREHFNLPIRLSNIAEASSTSMRNLQIVFKQELDISPNRYLQQFRLHRFREQLMKSSSVSEAAYTCGFKHLGRLTELYAKAFERNPSADLMVKSSLDTEVGDFFED